MSGFLALQKPNLARKHGTIHAKAYSATPESIGSRFIERGIWAGMIEFVKGIRWLKTSRTN